MEYGTRIKRMDVMLIDPDITSRGNLGALIRDFGCYCVRPFEDCETPIVSIFNKPPSVILCNWDPKGTFVTTILDTIRRHRSDVVAQTPVIVVSKNLSRQVMSVGLQAGATQFLANPVVPSDLVKKLVFVLNDKRQMIRNDGRLVYVSRPRKANRRSSAPNIIEFPASQSKVKSVLDASDPEDVLEL